MNGASTLPNSQPRGSRQADTGTAYGTAGYGADVRASSGRAARPTPAQNSAGPAIPVPRQATEEPQSSNPATGSAAPAGAARSSTVAPAAAGHDTGAGAGGRHRATAVTLARAAAPLEDCYNSAGDGGTASGAWYSGAYQPGLSATQIAPGRMANEAMVARSDLRQFGHTGRGTASLVADAASARQTLRVAAKPEEHNHSSDPHLSRTGSAGAVATTSRASVEPHVPGIRSAPAHYRAVAGSLCASASVAAAVTAWSYLYVALGAYVAAAISGALAAALAVQAATKLTVQRGGQLHATQRGATADAIYQAIGYTESSVENKARYIDSSAKRLLSTARQTRCPDPAGGWRQPGSFVRKTSLAARSSLRISQIECLEIAGG